MRTRLNVVYQWLIIGLSVVSLDQLTKYLAINILKNGEFSIVDDYIRFELHFNEGVAFSLPITGYFVPIAVLLLFTYILWRYGYKYMKFDNCISTLLIGLIYGGAISNIIDRIKFGSVVDFISVWNFPIFNLADTAISIGAILIIFFQNKIFIQNIK